MFENIIKFFKNIGKKEEKNNETENSKDAAKERLHLVLMQDRANVSADFLELMKQEIIKSELEVNDNKIKVITRSNKKIHRCRRRCNRCKANKQRKRRRNKRSTSTICKHSNKKHKKRSKKSRQKRARKK